MGLGLLGRCDHGLFGSGRIGNRLDRGVGRRIYNSPTVLQGDGGVAVFETFIPDLETIPIPAPGALMVGSMGVLFGGEDAEPK